jgi:hypothetical protein
MGGEFMSEQQTCPYCGADRHVLGHAYKCGSNENMTSAKCYERQLRSDKFVTAVLKEREKFAQVADRFVGCEQVAFEIRARGNK